MSISAIVILLYLVLFAGIGIYLSRNNKSSADWAIGGGTLGVAMLAAGVAGTRIGGAGTYGVAGDVISEGLGHLWYSVNSFAALFLAGPDSCKPLVVVYRQSPCDSSDWTHPTALHTHPNQRTPVPIDSNSNSNNSKLITLSSTDPLLHGSTLSRFITTASSHHEQIYPYPPCRRLPALPPQVPTPVLLLLYLVVPPTPSTFLFQPLLPLQPPPIQKLVVLTSLPTPSLHIPPSTVPPNSSSLSSFTFPAVYP